MQDMPDQLQRMLDFYGLAQDPFGEQVDATVFSNAGDRSELAEQFKHLLTFSPQDCLLMAPSGGGKTALAQQVLKRLDDEWRVAWVNGAEAAQLDDLVRELIGQLGLGLKADGDIASAFRNIADVIRQRTEDGEFFLLIVQHADQLPLDVQQWLQSFRTLSPRPDSRMRQLWLASSATAIEQADNDDQWYSLVLEPFNASDALTYLKDRFAGAGQLDGVPIEPRDVTRLNELAGGLPGELNQVVKDYLIAGTYKTTERRQGFPLTHVLAGAAVVTVVVLAVLYTQQPDNESVDITSSQHTNTETEEPTEVQQRLAEAAARIEARRQEGEASASKPEPVTESEPVSGTSPSDPPSETSTVATQTTENPTETSESTDVDTEQSETSTVVEADTGGDRGLMATAADSDYTLQLLGVRDRSAIERVVSGLENPDRFEIVSSTYQGEPWYVLIHGQYEDAAQARADIDRLPDVFSGQSPWPRTFSSLRADAPEE